VRQHQEVAMQDPVILCSYQLLGGQLALAEGRGDDGTVLLAKAVRTGRRAGHRQLSELASRMLSSPRRFQRRDLAASALTEILGVVWRHTAFAEPDRRGLVEERTSENPGPAARLTRRQLEVARLIAQGLTNRQIAARLGISDRTAEGHLDQIRDKLGCRSRVEIALWLMGQERQARSLLELELSGKAPARPVVPMGGRG
jgi:DNA-binding CsgD family transcriptional regulator